MNTFRNSLSRRDAERILDHRGDPGDPVAQLLDAAAARSGAVVGEDRAVALFRQAPVPGPVPFSLRRRLAALPTAALAAGALILGGGGGLALAATHGALNVPFTGHDHRSGHAPAAPSSTNPGLSRTPGASGSEGPGSDATHLPSATPSPSLTGLCRAYQAGAVPRKATNPAFAALSAAAGGAEGVSAFCADLVGTPTRPAHPTQAAHPTGAPTVRPTPDHSTIPPKPRPTQAATPTIPPKPEQAATPPTPPRPTRAAH